MACDTVSLYIQNNSRRCSNSVSRLYVELSIIVEYIVVLTQYEHKTSVLLCTIRLSAGAVSVRYIASALGILPEVSICQEIRLLPEAIGRLSVLRATCTRYRCIAAAAEENGALREKLPYPSKLY